MLKAGNSEAPSSSPRFLFTHKTVTKIEPKRTRGIVERGDSGDPQNVRRSLLLHTLHLPAVRKLWLKRVMLFSFTLPRRKVVVGVVGSVVRGQCTEDLDNNRHFTWLYTTSNSKS